MIPPAHQHNSGTLRAIVELAVVRYHNEHGFAECQSKAVSGGNAGHVLCVGIHCLRGHLQCAQRGEADAVSANHHEFGLL